MSSLPEKPWLRIDEVAEYFGVHSNTVRNWIEKGLLEANKLAGTSYRISRAAVLGFEANKKATTVTNPSQSFPMQNNKSGG